jgi:hypothetical protein
VTLDTVDARQPLYDPRPSMYFIKLVPRRVRTDTAFRAADPWNAGRVTDWTVEAYVMVPEHRPDPGNLYSMGASERFAIRSDVDGGEHFLPESLIRLWREQRVAAERLPALLHALEPTLNRTDYRMIPKVERWAALSWAVAAVSVPAFLYFDAIFKAHHFPMPPVPAPVMIARAVFLLLAMCGVGGVLGTTLGIPVVWVRRRRVDAQMRWATEAAGIAA